MYFVEPAAIHAYTFDSSTGLVGEKLGSYATAVRVGEAVVDPTGEWMLAVDANLVAVIGLDPQTGAVVSQRLVVLDQVARSGLYTGRIALNPSGRWVAFWTPGGGYDIDPLEFTLARFDQSTGDFMAATRVASPSPTTIGGSDHPLFDTYFGLDHLYFGTQYAYQSSYDRAISVYSYHGVMSVSRLPFDAITGTFTAAVSTHWLQERPAYLGGGGGFGSARRARRCSTATAARTAIGAGS